MEVYGKYMEDMFKHISMTYIFLTKNIGMWNIILDTL